MNYLQVYILLCADGSYYTGVTNDIDRRLWEHQEGLIKKAYTHNRRPLKLAWFSAEYDPNGAIELEKKIKGWSRNKKEALINSNWDQLPAFAKCLNETSHKKFNKKHINPGD